MRTLYGYVLWLIQALCLVTILYCSWLLLERPTFALVAACIVLATSVYIEHGMAE